jgi:hypothetical protein
MGVAFGQSLTRKLRLLLLAPDASCRLAERTKVTRAASPITIGVASTFTRRCMPPASPQFICRVNARRVTKLPSSIYLMPAEATSGDHHLETERKVNAEPGDNLKRSIHSANKFR